MTYARTERHGLVESMRRVGPDGPTMCAGWTNRDLAVHLILRERRLDATAGMFLPPLARHTAAVTAAMLATEWDELLTAIDEGPPWYSPFRIGDRFLNLSEMFVHHEDVLRGAADPLGPWHPRELGSGLEKALELPLRTVGRMTLRSSPATVTLRRPDGSRVLTAGRGPAVTVTGTIGELLLFVFGRTPAVVALDGDRDAVADLSRAKRGI